MSPVGSGGTVAAGADRDSVITQLLVEVSEQLQTASVHKSTLAALLMAAAESPDVVDHRSPAFEKAPASLNDALVALRLAGKVELTDSGYRLTDAARVEAEELHSAPFAKWLGQLVGRKLQEWQIAPRAV